MISSGRPEFFDQVWPLITHENDQVHLSALRSARRFRPSILGHDAAKQLQSLPMTVRQNVLHEIASNSGMDGMDLVASVAKRESEQEIKAIAVDAFAFRRAYRHAVDVLHGADEKTFDLVVSNGAADELRIEDEHVKQGLAAARERRRREDLSSYDQLRSIIYSKDSRDLGGELTAIIRGMEIEKGEDARIHLVFEARKRYARAVAEGLLLRVRENRPLFFRAEELIASAGFSLEDNSLLEISLAGGRRDDRAIAAASALGPIAAGRLIDTLLEAKKGVYDANGKYDEEAGERYRALAERVANVSGASLVTAIRARSLLANHEEITNLSDLICRHPHGQYDQGKPFDAETLLVVGSLAEEWGCRLLGSTDATRAQLASMAALSSHAPSVARLPLLRRLLDENLRRFQAFIREANATDWRNGKAATEARQPHTGEFQSAFLAINAPETATLMHEYLPDDCFGESAAVVLASQWTAAHEPKEGERWRVGVDFSRIEERRKVRAADPAATSPEAEVIFGAVESVMLDEPTERAKRHAVALALVAARLPHGERAATIQQLLSWAPRRHRAAMLQNLVLSGEIIDIESVKLGLAEMFATAKNERWILSGGHELNEWLRLLPFTNRPAETFKVVRGLPEEQRTPESLEPLIRALEAVPGDEAEHVLFQLAKADKRLYANHTWRNTVLRRGTVSAARLYLDLATNGVFTGGGETDHWQLSKQLGGLIGEHPDLRAHVYALLKNEPTPPGLALLAQAVAEAPDIEGLLLLIEIERERAFVSWRTVEALITEHIPSENWKGSFTINPVAAVELRQRVLAMTTDGGPSDIAAGYLNMIDDIRDTYGTPENEPRHPDLASGKPWPILSLVASGRA